MLLHRYFSYDIVEPSDDNIMEFQNDYIVRFVKKLNLTR